MSVTTRDIVSHTLYSANTVSAGFNSTSINRDSMDGFCIMANVRVNTTTSIIQFNLAASIDDSVYVDITDSTSTVTTTGQIMWNVQFPYYNYVRVESTMTTANIDCTITARSVRK